MENNSYTLPQYEKEREEKEKELLQGKSNAPVYTEDPNQQPSAGNSQSTQRKEVQYSTDYPFAPIIGPEYFENKKQDEEKRLKQRELREKGRMTAGALADTIRLIGHGTAIGKGAHETPWKKNENVERGMNSLKQYRDEYANAIRNIEDAELRDQLTGKQFKYREFLRGRKEKRADEQRAEDQDWRNKQYKDTKDWRENQFEYQQERDQVGDERWEKQHKLNEKRVANSRWYNQKRAENQTNKDKDDLAFPFRYQGSEYDIDLADKYHKAGVAEMANNYLSRLEQQRDQMDQEAWRKIENSDLYNSIKKLSEKDWPDDFAAINTILPEFFDPAIADEYGIDYEQLQQQERQPDGPGREDMGIDPVIKSEVMQRLERQKQEKEGNQSQEPAPAPKPQQSDTTQQQEPVPAPEPAKTDSITYKDLSPDDKQKLRDIKWAGIKNERDMRLKLDVIRKDFFEYNPDYPGYEDRLNKAAEAQLGYWTKTNPAFMAEMLQKADGDEQKLFERIKELLKNKAKQDN